jgi:glycosyltransferase involved in cell wall biosynthesis
MKTVYLEGRASGWEMHSLYKELVRFPPAGYKFITSADERVSKSQDEIYLLNKAFIKYGAIKTLYDYVRPLAYDFYYRLTDGSKPEEADLTYAANHLVFRKEPWIVDLEHVGALAAYGKIKSAGKTILKSLRSTNCKKIIPWTKMGKRSLLASISCGDLEGKTEVINLAVRSKKFQKKFDRGRLKILFLGTSNRANISDSFAIKGGNEVFRAFEKLKSERDNLELVVRSYVPLDVKKKYSGFKNVRIMDDVVPWEVLDYEFRTADIFIFPSHSTPGMAILDAMSYELPVVTTDVWANNELVDHGRTGFLIRGHSRVRYYDENFIPCWGEPKFMAAIRQVDPRMIKDLVDATEILIEDEKLRRKMGRAGRREIDEGKFSITMRNRKLKKVLDEAIEST